VTRSLRPSARVWAALGLLACVGVAAALSISSARARPPRLPLPAAQRGLRPFDESRAYALVKLQLSYGPRPAGSPAPRQVAAVLVHMLPGGHFEPVPGGLRNIVGGLPGREPAIVLGAHYDTTPVRGYLGANNSATGVGTVIEIARDLASDPRRDGRAVRFVLFDGEEAPAGFTDFLAQALRGSRAYVAAHAATTREMVLLDFIALHGERMPREQGSDAALWGRLRVAAAQVAGGAYFPSGTAGQIFDDHTPFTQAGIPAIDLIDFNYPCWQKTCDDLSQVSQVSLGAVGRSVLTLLRSERTRP
jgi:glutaminyl-peptide cyclotransferase